MSRTALIRSGVVENVVMLNSQTAWEPPAGIEAVPSETAAIGDLYQGWRFVRPAPPRMDQLRLEAFRHAMAYGNAITGKLTGGYADAEARSWTVQEQEARAVLAGEALPDGAMLPMLAQDRGVSLEDYARRVMSKATAFRAIAVAAVRLRRGAESLLSPELDTPEKLETAIGQLRAAAHAAAAEAGLL